MGRYIGDRNQVAIINESGTYGNASGPGVWPGLVTNNDTTTELNVNSVRYEGSDDRNVDIFVNGGEDHEGSMTLNPQDFRLFAYALGSVADTGVGPYVHAISEINSSDTWQGTSGTLCPFASFTVEDSQQTQGTDTGFVRTLNGCMVNTLSLTADEGGIAEMSVEYISQSNTYTSGTATAITASTTRPYVWQDFDFQLPGATSLTGVKSIEVSINNNLERRHYLNGSAVSDVPVPLNREYEISVTVDGNDVDTKNLYDKYFRGGSSFNCVLDVTDTSAGVGSRTNTMTFSGCRLFPMTAGTPNEGTNEQELTIVPKSCSINTTDAIAAYEPI